MPDKGAGALDVQQQWSLMKCPIINGILSVSGAIDWINVDLRFGSGGVTRVLLTPGEPTNVAALAAEGELDWTEVMPLCEAVDSERDIRVCAGEGGLGGDGFVALMTSLDNRLRWVAFFECSNPFVKVELLDQEVVARTSLSNTWRFPLDAPAAVAVL